MLLSRVRADIELAEHKWTPKALAITNDGRPCMPDDDRAVAWNTSGKVLQYGVVSSSVAILATYTAIGIGQPDPRRVNDAGYIAQLVQACTDFEKILDNRGDTLVWINRAIDCLTWSMPYIQFPNFERQEARLS